MRPFNADTERVSLRMAVIFDVAIIGGGIAGACAALAAQQRGAQTCVVRAAPGTTALMSGAWSGPLRAEVRTALAAAGYPLEAADRALAHERGRTFTAAFAGASHTRATLDDATLVCGFAGLPHFNASTLARIWKPQQPLAAHTIDLPGTPAGGWTAAALAAHLERRPELLLDHLPRPQAPRVIFPAVLGIERVLDVLAALRSHDVVATEALAATPSIPGWRLQLAIDRALAAHGVTVHTGRATLHSSGGRRVEAIKCHDQVITARSFILATGKFVGGGIAANEQFQETVFDLPVWLEQLGDVFTAPDPLLLTDTVRAEPQPLLHAGVHTDASARPVDRAGRVVWENVFVAGTIRADWPAAQSRLGDCAEDGWTAGLNASA